MTEYSSWLRPVGPRFWQVAGVSLTLVLVLASCSGSGSEATPSSTTTLDGVVLSVTSSSTQPPTTTVFATTTATTTAPATTTIPVTTSIAPPSSTAAVTEPVADNDVFIDFDDPNMDPDAAAAVDAARTHFDELWRCAAALPACDLKSYRSTIAPEFRAEAARFMEQRILEGITLENAGADRYVVKEVKPGGMGRVIVVICEWGPAHYIDASGAPVDGVTWSASLKRLSVGNFDEGWLVAGVSTLEETLDEEANPCEQE